MKPIHNLTAVVLGALSLGLVAVGGCTSDGSSDKQRSMSSGMNSGMSNGGQPLEGNPGATTGPTAGYPQSDPSGYHPLSDDTNRYHPAQSGNVQPNR